MMRDHVVGRTLACDRVAYGKAQRTGCLTDTPPSAYAQRADEAADLIPISNLEAPIKTAKRALRSARDKLMPMALSVALALTCTPAAGVAYGAESDPAGIESATSDGGSGQGVDPAVDSAGVSAAPGKSGEQEQPIVSGSVQRSFVVATTLKNTTVPIVKATLPLMSASVDQGLVQPDASGGDRTDPDDPAASSPQVRGSVVHDGMIFAMTADDEMALVAIDAAKLDGAATAERMLALPTKLAPSKTETYRLTSIASQVFGATRTLREQKMTAEPASEADGAPHDPSEAEALDEGDDDPHVVAPVREGGDVVDAASTAEATADEGSAAEESLACLGIPATVRDIAADAFDNYEPLEYLVVAEGNETYSSYDGVLYDAAQTSLLLVPEGRRGAVRIPDTVMKVDAEMFSHRDDLALLIDADSTAITSEDGFLHDQDLSTFDFPVPIAVVDRNTVVAATPNFSETAMDDGPFYDEIQWVEALANAPDTIELWAEGSEAIENDQTAAESFERTNAVVPLETANASDSIAAGFDSGSFSDEVEMTQDPSFGAEQTDGSPSLMSALDRPEGGMQTNENIAYVAEDYVLATPQSATYIENDRGTLQYRASFSFARSTNVYVRGDIPTTDGGQNAHWLLENGKLSIWCDKDDDGNSYVISGDFLVEASDVPWASVRALVDQVHMDRDLRAESLFYWFAYMTNLKDANGIFIPEGCMDTRAMFYYCSNLVKLPSDLELPASVENVYIMFEGCSSLTAIPAGFTAEHVTTSIRCLFKYCTSLVALPAGFRLPAAMPWDSSIPYEHVFYRCDALTAFPDGFDLPSLPAGHSYGATMLLCADPTPTYCVSPGANLAAYFATFGGTDPSSCRRTLTSSVPAGYSKVDFMANDAVIMTQLIGPDKMIHDPADPGIAGYRFGGWYTSTSFVTVYDFSRPYDEQASEYPYAGKLYALLLKEDELSYSGDLPTTDGNMNAHWSFEDGVLSLWCDTDSEGNSYVISDEGVAYGEREAPWNPIKTLVTSIHMDPALKTETMSLWFNGMANLVDVSGAFIPEGCLDASGIFKNCARLTTLPADLVIPASVKTVYTLFEGCFALKTVPQNFSVEHVGDIRCLFKHCTSLVSLPERFRLPSSIEWDGTGHIPYEHVFYNCYSLTSLPAGFDLPSIPSGQAYSRDTMLCIAPTVTYCKDPGPNLVRYFADFGGEGSSKCNRTLSTTVPSGYSSVVFMYGDEVLSTQLIGSDGMIVDPGDPRIENLSFAGWFTDAGHSSRYNFSLPWNAQAVLTPFSGTLYALLIDATTLVTEGDLPTTDGGQNAHWRFDDGTLSIWCDKGPDGNSYVISSGICTGIDGPWHALRTLVTDIKMDPDVKAESVDFWFAGMTNLVKLGSGMVFVPDGCVTSEAMFKNCTSLETLPADFFLPVGMESVYTMFEGCSALRTVPAGFTAEHVTRSVRCLFKFCISLSTLPEGFRLPARLGFGAVSGDIPYEHVFYRCDSLASFPPGFDIPSIPSGSAYSREMMLVPKATLTYCSSPGPNLVKYFDDFGGEGPTKCGRTLVTTIPSGRTKVDFVRIGDTPEEDSVIASQMVGSDNMISDPGDPGIFGTTFAGWFIDRSCRISYDFSVPFDRQSSVGSFDGRLYAQLLPSHTITWNVNGGTWSAEAWDSFDRRTTVSHGGVPVQPIEPQRIGYDFIGWNIDPDAISESVVGAREDATYYALWKERSYTITYVANKGGSMVSAPAPKTVKFETESFLLPSSAVAARIGFGLVGWTIDEGPDDLWASATLPTDGVGACDETVTVKTLFAGGEPPSSSFDLYTLWRHDQYDIVYDLGGGAWKDEEGPTSYQYGLPEADGSGAVAIPYPVRDRWIFSDWKVERIDASGNPLADTSGFGADEGIDAPSGASDENAYRLTAATRGHWKLTAIWQPVVSIDLPIEGVYDDDDPQDSNEITIYLDTNTGLSGTAQGAEAARMTSFEIRSTTPVSTTLSIASRAESDDYLLSLLSGSKRQEFIDSMRFSMAFTGGVSELDGVDVDENGNKTVVRILDRKNDVLSPTERLHVVPCLTAPIYVRGALDLLANTDLIRSGDTSIRRTDEKGLLAELIWTVDASEWYEENLPGILSGAAV